MLITLSEAARKKGLSPATLRRHIFSGQLPAKGKFGNDSGREMREKIKSVWPEYMECGKVIFHEGTVEDKKIQVFTANRKSARQLRISNLYQAETDSLTEIIDQLTSIPGAFRRVKYYTKNFAALPKEQFTEKKEGAVVVYARNFTKLNQELQGMIRAGQCPTCQANGQKGLLYPLPGLNAIECMECGEAFSHVQGAVGEKEAIEKSPRNDEAPIDSPVGDKVEADYRVGDKIKVRGKDWIVAKCEYHFSFY